MMMEFAPQDFRSPRHFARHMLDCDRLQLRPLPDAVYVPASHPSQSGIFGMSCILFRSGCWQVELLAGLPGTKAPMHRHNRVASADLLLCGGVTGAVGLKPFGANRGELIANLVTVPRGAWHGGAANASGVFYLSFQQWHDGPPDFIAEDWESYDEPR
jgi:hypothetical protein